LQELEINKVYNMDCLEGMKLIKDKSIDLIFCDLPFGTTQNKWDTIIPFEPLWREYKRIIKDNGAIVLFAQGIFTSKLMLSNEKMFKYKIIWEKSKATNFLNAKKQPLRKYEELLVFYKKQPTYNPQFKEGTPYNKGVRKDQQTGSYGEFQPVEVKSEDGKRYPTDIVYFKTAESEGDVIHPTQKPIALCEYIIKTFTNENDLILDNCMGSFSTAIASLKNNRKYIGFEKEKKYIDLGYERLNKIS
jgi:site-specific DNA-methyltransferase (adenine-specific)